MDVTALNGGLNLWELDYRLGLNQSPDLLNVYWQDGSLSSRKGQAYAYAPYTATVTTTVTDAEAAVDAGRFGKHLADLAGTVRATAGTYQFSFSPGGWTYSGGGVSLSDFGVTITGEPTVGGTISVALSVDSVGLSYACYEKPWHGYLIAHKGTSLYKIDPETGEHTSIYRGSLSAGSGGSFFVFGDKLYYMNGHEYVSVNAGCDAQDVDPYTPVTIVNRKPDGTGGSTNEDENRISAKKRVRFTTDGTSTVYKLPVEYTPLDSAAVCVDLSSPAILHYNEKQTYANFSAFPEIGEEGVYYYATDVEQYYNWTGAAYAAATAPADASTFSVDRSSGEITFHTAPAAAATPSPSNLEMCISKENADARNSILQCTCVTVYGGDKQLAIVCGGPPGQPNAYFWSGSTEMGFDPSYFPFDYYNYAGANADEGIVGFGKQQAMLVIFKENSIGKSYFQTTTVDGVDYLKLPYTSVNDTLGCNLEGSIRLIQNNLVFANTYGGVHVLLDSTAYGENTVRRISRNVNGDEEGKRGLLHDLRSVAATGVTSLDDQQRYWLVANGHAYLWDYTISGYSRKEESMSWFYFDNISPVGWVKTMDDSFYLRLDGSLVKFVDQFSDFDEPITRRYSFAVLNFGTYEVFKDILRVVFAVRSDTDSAMTITYKTDYEERKDLTPIRSYSWRLFPRNLAHRSLAPVRFAGTAIRTPRCFRVRHFSMTLENNTLNTDMSVIQAQIVYRYSKKDR